MEDAFARSILGKERHSITALMRKAAIARAFAQNDSGLLKQPARVDFDPSVTALSLLRQGPALPLREPLSRAHGFHFTQSRPPGHAVVRYETCQEMFNDKACCFDLGGALGRCYGLRSDDVGAAGRVSKNGPFWPGINRRSP